MLVNRYERDPAARAACLAHYGYRCSACGRTLEDLYGEVGRRVIQVHHLRQLSEGETERSVNPVKDLRPLCPNCHTIVHTAKPPRSIEAGRPTRSLTSPGHQPGGEGFSHLNLAAVG